jgi:transaldolase
MGVGALTRRAVFLDRDGVINRAVIRDGKPHPPADLSQLEVLPGVPEALEQLRAAGYRLIVVTNQPDVARGKQTREAVEAIHAQLLARDLPIDDFRVCYHDDEDGCDCRKPKAGLLLSAALEENLDLASSFLVGDRWRDVEAGMRAGCTTVFVDHGYAEPERSQPHVRVKSLAEAADWILACPRRKDGTGLMDINDLKVKIFADGANKAGILEMYRKPYIKGFTTNPTLMRKAGIADYRDFALDIVQAIPDRPLSFEVFADEFPEMECQAREIATWGSQVYVKIPITNTRREPSYDLIRRLSHDGIKVNVTAMMPLAQVRDVAACVAGGAPCFVSVFAGRIADTGRDPVPLMAAAVELLRPTPNAELIWASPRELLNIFQADAIGCHIITVTNDVLKKLTFIGKDLDDYSLDTVKMFYQDAQQAGYTL